MTTAQTERFRAVCHKRHGWIVAPEGCWFEDSPNGKSVWLHMDREPRFSDHFPFGTRFNATSIVNYADPL